MNNVIPFHYDGQPVRFSSDGWIDASSAAKRFGKEPTAWLRTIETVEYVSALAEALFGKGVSETDLEKLRLMDSRGKQAKAFTLELAKSTGLAVTKAGRGGGTWLHPKLAVAFARWLDVRFAVWCDLHIDALLRGELTEKQRFDQACKRLDDGKKVASQNGRGLAIWKRQKPPLEREVEYRREQLQMILGFDDEQHLKCNPL
ncbi:KilA-N domain-containing protein [uncultured Pseudomonas sp.]|uniref:KilA-N domain-containing protein n=1 Tax=uncultured Pseudomonas sp. TaxID=114707 RepID=UPI0030DA3FEE|tara:strand:+ start:40933 stop:41538 length:606 start_codon:yes stop_codon:yes gene_type:complete